jgi:hypothetical protein
MNTARFGTSISDVQRGRQERCGLVEASVHVGHTARLSAGQGSPLLDAATEPYLGCSGRNTQAAADVSVTPIREYPEFAHRPIARGKLCARPEYLGIVLEAAAGWLFGRIPAYRMYFGS